MPELTPASSSTPRTPGRLRRLLRAWEDSSGLASSSSRQLRFGLGGLALVALLIIASAALAVLPISAHTYHARFAEAGMVRSGDDVRVAGVSVGSVREVALAGDHVDVTFTADRDVRIGDQSTIAVKMLTGVGGYFLDIDSLGDRPLGDAAIPEGRVRLPYSLVETFQQAEPKIRAIDPAPLRQSLAELQRSLSTRPGQFSDLITSMSAMVTSLTRQKDELGGFLQTIAQFSHTIDENGDQLTAVMRDMNVYYATARVNVAGYRKFMQTFDLVQKRLIPPANFYQQNLASMESQFNAISQQIGGLLGKYQGMIDGAMAQLKELQKSVRPDGTINIAGAGPLVSGFCVPIQGAPC